jgi:hypothetical protein
MPLALIVTVYFNVSPGSALPSISTSVNNESVLVAVTVGDAAKGMAIGTLLSTDRFGFNTAGVVSDFLTFAVSP